MTDTPETDADVFFAEVAVNRTEAVVTAELARKLERERNLLMGLLRSLGEDIGVQDWDPDTIVRDHKDFEQEFLREIEGLRGSISREYPSSGDCTGCGEYHVCTPECPVERAKAEAHSIVQ